MGGRSVVNKEQLAENLALVRARMAAAALRAGRDPQAVRLVAVSKTHPAEAIQMAYDLGVRDFGESRVEEALPKMAAVHAWLAQQPGAQPITWHLIGHVQSRKAAAAVGSFHLIHSVDRVKLARKLAQLGEARAQTQAILLEVNLSGEASKFGFRPEEVGLWVDEIAALPRLMIQGLMTIAPMVEDPDQARPIFQRLRALAATLAQRHPQLDWSQLSMGMTDDFEVAIEEGATLVRIGRAIFGEREV